jgi:murein DD-endopeptidase MepM/ murein hydrolase activator NlpD
VVNLGYDPRRDGNCVVIKGLGERRQYLYAHMVHPSTFQRGDLVHVGQIVGYVGKTGNARTVGCHLHFEIHVRGRPINPEPYLRAWDRYS